MTFEPGERVVYTGAYKSCLRGLIPQGAETVVQDYKGKVRKGGSGDDSYVYVEDPNGPGHWACYIRDLESIARRVPEEYEAWFVA